MIGISHRQIRLQFAALEQSAERARLALGCSFSSATEFEAAVIRARYPRGVPLREAASLRLALAATILSSLVALAALAL
ncbi:MAG TPA: hypothetical protein VIH40_03875 [Xanthobacteraceae bacterium]